MIEVYLGRDIDYDELGKIIYWTHTHRTGDTKAGRPENWDIIGDPERPWLFENEQDAMMFILRWA